MISFKSDYAQIAHPRMLQALINANMEHSDGYGEDKHCKNAIRLIRQALGNDGCFVTFMPTGTIANLTAISHMLRQHQAVISADTGHIFTNETGAIEATGHKVIACAGENAKLTPELIVSTLAKYTHVPHVVQPKMVYLSQSTEWGTVYNKEELTAISGLCREKGLYLYVDGARLGSALAALRGDLTLADMATLTDAFTFGGTKNGALLGEAVIIPNKALAEDFMFSVRQKGGLLAKGNVLGIQFEELFKDDFYIELADHANRMSSMLKEGLQQAGYRFHVASPTNQQFVYVENQTIERLKQNYLFLIWKAGETHSLIRLITSWATSEEDVRGLLAQM